MSKAVLAELLLRIMPDDERRRLDRLAWYVIKLVGAAEDVKDDCVRQPNNMCTASLTKFVNIVREVDDRLGFKGRLATVAEAVVDAIKNSEHMKRHEVLMRINEAVKRFVMMVMLLACSSRR